MLLRQELIELGGIAAARLGDAEALASLVVAAAGAVGISAETPPVVRRSPSGVAVGLVCREGHIVLHTLPEAGVCLVNIVGLGEAPVARGTDAIARRLAATSRTAVPR
jgi:S-adenosylmethionine/arginine decarboxylase-like enzyme